MQLAQSKGKCGSQCFVIITWVTIARQILSPKREVGLRLRLFGCPSSSSLTASSARMPSNGASEALLPNRDVEANQGEHYDGDAHE